ncbi:MAG: bifunctional glutamate N-acetyltransferase/amino-acid acetyltransferase ArgJ [Candidatus Omnitrophica bacterium]|nr:bifunctional glutamate N-acetyltransferase/amino-acid acetyltransferase ArgJ [Candidatus Omnitrophota bacterium]
MVKKPSWEKKLHGTVTSPKGFYASGIYCGIKRKKKFDAALIYSKTPCVAAATFTTNRVKAWPVLHSMKSIQAPFHQAILASSGNANCVNGAKGKVAVEESVSALAGHLGIQPQEILIAQTGIIGVPFPITRFKRALPDLVKRVSEDGGHAAAKGILTTDLAVKEVALSFNLRGQKVTIGAMGKGSGMVHPNMATMLCFITTDAAITKPLLGRAVRHAVDDTFNKMAIDNDMSTNDTVFILANGESGAPQIQKVDQDYWLFRDVLEEVCKGMARKMIEDGEGVQHICHLKISGAKSPTDAEKVARQISNSMLFKTMLAGANANWGRIVAALGASGVDFKMEHINIFFNDVNVIHKGKLRALNLPKARKVLQAKEYTIDMSIGNGRGRSDFITCDLTTKYVEINGSYS